MNSYWKSQEYCATIERISRAHRENIEEYRESTSFLEVGHNGLTSNSHVFCHPQPRGFKEDPINVLLIPAHFSCPIDNTQHAASVPVVAATTANVHREH